MRVINRWTDYFADRLNAARCTFHEETRMGNYADTFVGFVICTLLIHLSTKLHRWCNRGNRQRCSGAECLECQVFNQMSLILSVANPDKTEATFCTSASLRCLVTAEEKYLLSKGLPLLAGCQCSLRPVYTSDFCPARFVQLSCVYVQTSDISRYCNLDLDSHHSQFEFNEMSLCKLTCCRLLISHCVEIAANCRRNWDQS